MHIILMKGGTHSIHQTGTTESVITRTPLLHTAFNTAAALITGVMVIA